MRLDAMTSTCGSSLVYLTSDWVIVMCPKSIGWLHSKCAQMLEFVDSLHLMFDLLNIIWLPQGLWSTSGIVAGRWARSTLHGVRIALVAIIVGTTIVGTSFEGVIVALFFEIGSGLVRLHSYQWIGSLEWQLAFWERWTPMIGRRMILCFGAFSSPLHKLSIHDDSFLEAFGPPFHKFSTHDDWFHPDTRQNKGNQSSYPV